MLKSDLVHELAKNFVDLPEHTIGNMINAIIEEMAATLASGGRIEIREFGTFNLTLREPSETRNPKTGETFMSHAKYYPRYRTSQKLLDRLNKKEES